MLLAHDTLTLRGLFRTEQVRLDDVLAVERGRVRLTAGGSRAVPSKMAEAVARAVALPEIPDLACARAALTAWLAGPHPPARAARHLLEVAARLQASDLHLEASADDAVLRLRIDGELLEVARVPPSAAGRLIAAWKGQAGCLPYRRDVPQEGRIPRAGVAADVRASFVPAALGERVALRLFGRMRALDELGFDAAALAGWTKALSSPRGLALVAGSAGAGKTTTLYASLAHIARARGGAHLSIEDPVEHRLRLAGVAVDQLEADTARGVTPGALLVAALRQDVDVISVGEVRTPEEAALAVHAAHTGRLVLAGIHAGSPQEAVQRMLDLGVDARLLRQTLEAVLHQSLARSPRRAVAELATVEGGTLWP